MKNSIRMIAMGFAALVFLTQTGFVDAADIKVLSAAGMRPVMEDLGPRFERATGHKLAMAFAAAGVIVKRIQDGEAGDIVITPWNIETLAKDGKVMAGTVTIIARAGLGVAVRKGAPKPDISSPESFKSALLGAKSITYLNPAQDGESGFLFARVLDRLGIATEMKSKTVIPKTTGAVGGLVVNGDAEIAVLAVQHIQFISGAGIELVGRLPSNLQETMVFSAAILTSAKNTEASRVLLNFLRTLEATTVMKEKGMDPA